MTRADLTEEVCRTIEMPGNESDAVVGDVNSTIAGALAPKKIGIDVVHSEAGLQSFDRSMPGEINSIATDAISDLFLITEESDRRNLWREGAVPERIHTAGNVMIGSLRRHVDQVMNLDARERLTDESSFGLVALRRPANVDNERQLAEIVTPLNEISQEASLYWPVHPRTQLKVLSAAPISGDVHLLEPLGYLDSINLQAQSAVVLTDSGGIQEETTVLGLPCLTIRENTERPVTIECDTNRLAGTSKVSILKACRQTVADPRNGQIPPLWEGQARERAHVVLRQYFLSAMGDR